MQALLVQHARAREKDEDPQRRLSDAGWAEVRRVAAFMADAGVQVARIWHSGKARAAQTAEALAQEIKPPLGVRQGEHLGPMDDPAIWAARLEEMEQDVMLVGHLPHLRRLASRLLTGGEGATLVQFQNAGVVCLTKVGGGEWALRWALTPELLVR